MDRRLDTPAFIDAQIVFKLPKSFPSEALLHDLNEKGIKTAVLTRPDNEVYAALEWMVEGAIAILLVKPLFDGFLKEAGKDGYVFMKSWLKRTAVDARQIRVGLVSADRSTQKLNPAYTQSLSFTPKFQLKNKVYVKLLFDERLSDEEWGLAVEGMFDIIEDHYQNYPNDQLTEAAVGLTTSPHHSLYALIDMDTKQWVLHNDRTMLELERGKPGQS